MRSLGKQLSGTMKLNNCQLFKDIFLRAHELSIPTCINLDKEGPRTSWLSEDFLAKVKNKKKMHRQRNQECVPGDEFRNTIQLCGDLVRKDKAQLEK